MLTVLREGRELEARLLGEGPLPVALDDKKSVNATVDTAVRRLAFKPAANYLMVSDGCRHCYAMPAATRLREYPPARRLD